MFRELLHHAFDLVTEDVLMDRIFCAFDRTCCGSVRLEDWMSGLSVFLRGTLGERTAFCFLVYDLNNDGFITRDEMFSLLKWVNSEPVIMNYELHFRTKAIVYMAKMNRLLDVKKLHEEMSEERRCNSMDSKILVSFMLQALTPFGTKGHAIPLRC